MNPNSFSLLTSADNPMKKSTPAQINHQGYDNLGLEFESFNGEPYVYNTFQDSQIK